MPVQYRSVKINLDEWLRSAEFDHAPEADLLLAVIIQAVEDSNTTLPDPPPLPPPPNPFTYRNRNNYYADLEAYRRKAKNVKARIKQLQELAGEQKQARRWLMAPGSTFKAIASRLDIDADTIRAALVAATDWARSYSS